MEVASILICLFLSSLLSYPLLKKMRRPWRIPKQRAKLPPGSMGWPFVGETLQLYTQDPNVFFVTRQKRF
jgi:(+)-abscisic acid 8'-hydroxylase